MSATMASMVAFESGSNRPVLPPTGQKPLTEWQRWVRLRWRSSRPATAPDAGAFGRRARTARAPGGAAAADAHLAEQQVNEDAGQRKDADDDQPRDARRRIAMRTQEDAHDGREFREQQEDAQQHVGVGDKHGSANPRKGGGRQQDVPRSAAGLPDSAAEPTSAAGEPDRPSERFPASQPIRCRD